eukprot:TRINITY_DN97988_c0_g1_i1.p1 TRINITY_DN97988_c0_g1~~TRINITY_DN97988_c0_g1_i1.p1  ORF type:complete len:172 (+),score=16.09 TRINITY_DN97988_c0_g1_i1:38-553(+)
MAGRPLNFLLVYAMALYCAAYVPRSRIDGVKLYPGSASRDQIPSFSQDATGTIKLRQTAVGYDNELMQFAATMMDEYHSAIQVEAMDNGEAVNFTVEMWDAVVGNESLVPQSYTADGRPVWLNNTVVVYTPGLDEEHWGAFGQSVNGAVLAEKATGEQLNMLMMLSQSVNF